jgi:hypothetical protein
MPRIFLLFKRSEHRLSYTHSISVHFKNPETRLFFTHGEPSHNRPGLDHARPENHEHAEAAQHWAV